MFAILIFLLFITIYVIFWSVYLRGRDDIKTDHLLFAISDFSTSLIPFALPISLILCLVLSLKKLMSTRSVLFKNLTCFESLGAVNVLAIDKTGTLTENKLHVTHVLYGCNKQASADEFFYDSEVILLFFTRFRLKL